jgi:hypothetical protein
MSSSLRVAFVIARLVAAGFALYATARHPYGYYIVTRWVVFVTCLGGVLISWRAFSSCVFFYAAVGLLFNPIVPFHFTRNTWHKLDIVAAGVLLGSIVLDARPSQNP